MPKTTHTPTPWHLGTDGNVYSGETQGRLIAIVDHNANSDFGPSSKPANGALIVQAVNAHADLLAAVQRVLRALDMHHAAAGKKPGEKGYENPLVLMADRGIAEQALRDAFAKATE